MSVARGTGSETLHRVTESDRCAEITIRCISYIISLPGVISRGVASISVRRHVNTVSVIGLEEKIEL